MPFKDPAKRRKLARQCTRYRRALKAGEPFALAAEQARERAKNAMSPFHALMAQKASRAETQAAYAACLAARAQATREYQELRAALVTDREPAAEPEAREDLLREIRRLRTALEQATTRLRALG